VGMCREEVLSGGPDAGQTGTDALPSLDCRHIEVAEGRGLGLDVQIQVTVGGAILIGS